MKRFLTLLSILILASAAHAEPSRENGTIIRPAHDVTVPTTIREKLSEAADIRAFASLPDGDSVVVYDTVRDKPDTADFMDNSPQIAFFHNGNVVFQHNSDASTGPIRFDGMALLLNPSRSLVAFAFTLGVDGAGTFFVLVGEQAGQYKLVASLRGTQAQLRFDNSSPEQLELWTADGQFNRNPDYQCVWCLKYYTRKTYAWQNGKLKLIQIVKGRRGHKPETFEKRRFVIR